MQNLDAIDRAIVVELYLNCRLSYEELGAKFGLSTSSVWRRVKLLQDDGVIERFYVNIHTDCVYPRTVIAIIEVEDSVDEEDVVDTIFSNPHVFEVGSIINGTCFAYIETLTSEECNEFEENIQRIEGVKSVQTYKGLSPTSDRKTVVSIPEFTCSEKRVIAHLIENPRLQIGELSSVTDFSARKTKKILGVLTSDNRLWFSLRANTARKRCISFVLKIEIDDIEKSSEVHNWIEENIHDFWWSFTSGDAMFSHFTVEDSTKTSEISEKVKTHPAVVSAQSFIHIPCRKGPKIGEKMLKDLLEEIPSTHE
ncbi:MAG: Lrp/AsnC family transcriptional regulator [Candidatus Thorarchaeota archaeon]